jgi:hypothetical protein
MRRFVYAAAALVVVIVGYQIWQWTRSPPIARGPSGDFIERLRSKFPVGTPETELIRELQAEGFGPVVREGEIRTIRPGTPDRKYTTLSIWSFPCERAWWVLWRTDGNGRVTDVTGSYYGNLSCL